MNKRMLPRIEDKRRFEAFAANKFDAATTAAALNLPEATFRSWIRRFRTILIIHKLSFDDTLDASFWDAYLKGESIEPGVVAAPPRDAVETYRDKKDAIRARRERDEALDRASRAEDLRRSVFGLVNDPLEPVSFQPDPGRAGGRVGETIVCFLSDLHWGEVIDYAAMDGLNSYDVTIARARLRRYFQAVLDLATKHWSGEPPERLILILGGDMISGEIHQELMKTNSLMALPAVRDVVAYLKAGIKLLLENLQCPIDVISLAGNHGRSTFKPESKLSVETSYDTLVSDFLELELRAVDIGRLNFYVPVSNDAVFSVYGYKFLATHGDKIGSRGGQGFVGVAATAARGFKKIAMDYAARGVHIDTILIGHFHTALKLEEGYVNGCLIGPSEFSRDGRFRPAPATQLFLAIHPRRGVSQYRYVNVGSEEEGTLYERPQPPVESIRPRYRVKAGSSR